MSVVKVVTPLAAPVVLRVLFRNAALVAVLAAGLRFLTRGEQQASVERPAPAE
jgi:hypothetical protein